MDAQEPLRFGALLIVCILAISSWKLFEHPMIQIGNRLDRYFRNRRSTSVLADQTSD